jgi:hypothetical protein
MRKASETGATDEKELSLCMESSRERKRRSGDYAAAFFLREAAVSVWRDQLGSSSSHATYPSFPSNERPRDANMHS